MPADKVLATIVHLTKGNVIKVTNWHSSVATVLFDLFDGLTHASMTNVYSQLGAVP